MYSICAGMFAVSFYESESLVFCMFIFLCLYSYDDKCNTTTFSTFSFVCILLYVFMFVVVVVIVTFNVVSQATNDTAASVTFVVYYLQHCTWFVFVEFVTCNSNYDLILLT